LIFSGPATTVALRKAVPSSSNFAFIIISSGCWFY
jgi:hypothetical protein